MNEIQFILFLKYSKNVLYIKHFDYYFSEITPLPLPLHLCGEKEGKSRPNRPLCIIFNSIHNINVSLRKMQTI